MTISYEQAQISIMAQGDAKKLEAKTREVTLLKAAKDKQKSTFESQIVELQQKLKDKAPVTAGLVNEDVAGKIRLILRSQFWRKVKFLQCEDDLKKCVEFVAPKFEDWQKKHGGKTPDSEAYKHEINQFIVTYGTTITKCINEYRSTCQSQMKQAWTKLPQGREKGPDSSPAPSSCPAQRPLFEE